jgi:uncharacterized protein involved in cysteine biosynthesis
MESLFNLKLFISAISGVFSSTFFEYIASSLESEIDTSSNEPNMVRTKKNLDNILLIM